MSGAGPRRLGQWAALLAALAVWALRGFRKETLPAGLPRLLGRMKGLPQKLGQFLGYTARSLEDFSFLQVDGVALDPAATRAAFGGRLARFDEADFVPISAASICQVHRARVGDERVAVKLRYPGIDGALRFDFAVARTVLALLAAPLPRVLEEPLRRGRRYLDLLAIEMARETDLLREAEMITAFHGWLAGRPFPESAALEVPAVERSRSTSEMLVTRFADGEPADRFLRRNPRHCTRFKQLLFAFHRHALLELGRLHADPHPGNFLCRDEAGELRVAVVDFGCTASFTEAMRTAFGELVTGVAGWDAAKVRGAALALGFREADLEALGLQLQLYLEVILAPFLAAKRDEATPFAWEEWRLTYKLNMIGSSRTHPFVLELPESLLLLLRVLAAFDRYR